METDLNIEAAKVIQGLVQWLTNVEQKIGSAQLVDLMPNNAHGRKAALEIAQRLGR